MSIVRVAVSGANGFIGATFMSVLERSLGFVGTGLVRQSQSVQNLRTTDYSIESLHKIFEENPPELFVHAAGSASVAHSISHPESDHTASVGLVKSATLALRSLKTPPAFLYVSSAAVYGNPVRLPVQESDETAPISPYGEHRLECERLVHEYSKDTGKTCFIARAFSLYGAKQRQLVLWEIAKQALTSDKIVIQGTGNELRDFLSVEDFVQRALRLATTKTNQTVVVNIASGNSLSIHELARKILFLLDHHKPIVSLSKPQTGNPANWAASTRRYRELTGDEQSHDLDGALRACLEQWKAELS